MQHKLMICPWFGPLPEWAEAYHERIGKTGCDFLFDYDLESFRQRVGDVLGVRCPIEPGSAKIQDYRPAFGKLYADELAGYDWWGHTDYDCVYGRVTEFVTDELLAGCDIQTDCAHEYIAGPWTLYRNHDDVNRLFQQEPRWRLLLEDDYVYGWVETLYSMIARREMRVRIDFFHDYRDVDRLEADGDRLIYAGREISYFHFRYTKRWPL